MYEACGKGRPGYGACFDKHFGALREKTALVVVRASNGTTLHLIGAGKNAITSNSRRKKGEEQTRRETKGFE